MKKLLPAVAAIILLLAGLDFSIDVWNLWQGLPVNHITVSCISIALFFIWFSCWANVVRWWSR